MTHKYLTINHNKFLRPVRLDPLPNTINNAAELGSATFKVKVVPVHTMMTSRSTHLYPFNCSIVR